MLVCLLDECFECCSRKALHTGVTSDMLGGIFIY
jgi:hypothetical protein